MSENDRVLLDQVLEQKRAELAASLTDSQFFEVFVAEQTLKDYDLSYDELEGGIVGDGGDGGVDGLYVFVNGELVTEDFDFSALKRGVLLDVVVVQAKLSAGFSEAVFDKLNAVFEDLFELSHQVAAYKSVYNDELRAAVETFRRAHRELASRFPRLRFRIIYGSRGLEVHPNVSRKATLLAARIASLYSASETTTEFLGASQLLALARQAPRKTFSLQLAETPISSSGDVGFISLVRLRDYMGFITDEHGNLRKHIFEANVRDYQGSTEVNEEIADALKNRTREDFWWLNNGVTIVAQQAVQSGKSLTIEDPQIVNGLQTSTEIFNYFKTSNTESEDRHLLVRVIVPEEAESRDRIIKATNSQTYVPPASLRATDKVQRDIEQYLKSFGLFYDRRKNFYKNEGKALDHIVSIPLMAQALMAVMLRRPDTARARPSSLLKGDAEYRALFDPKLPIETYRACIVLVKRAEAHLRSAGKSPKDRNNLRFYLAMHVACCLTGKVDPSPADLCSLKLEQLSRTPFDISLAAVEEIYEELGADDQAAKGSEFVKQLRADLEDGLIHNPERFRF